MQEGGATYIWECYEPVLAIRGRIHIYKLLHRNDWFSFLPIFGKLFVQNVILFEKMCSSWKLAAKSRSPIFRQMCWSIPNLLYKPFVLKLKQPKDHLWCYVDSARASRGSPIWPKNTLKRISQTVIELETKVDLSTILTFSWPACLDNSISKYGVLIQILKLQKLTFGRHPISD